MTTIPSAYRRILKPKTNMALPRVTNAPLGSKKIQDIEVLRALAVMVVLWQHIDNLFPVGIPALQSAFQFFGGTFGVDLFFCVSGFVITRDLIPKIKNAAPNRVWRVAIAFWIKRMWRLWPAAWFWLIAILIAATLFNQSGAFGPLKNNIHATWMALINLYNIHFAQCFMRCQVGASFVYWSLSLEEQFYILFPILFIFLGKRLWWLFAALIIIQLLMPVRGIWWMVFRSDAICLGVFIALASQGPYWPRLQDIVKKIPATVGVTILCAGIALMGALSGTLKWTTHYMSLIVLTSTLLVLLAACNANVLMPIAPLRRILVAIGARSYGIYLAHVPIYFAVREIFHRFDWQPASTQTLVFASLALCALLLIIAVEVVYRYIETPLRQIGARKAQLRLAS